jgi:RNA polymerase sigma-70 factor (ECF subfamily)
MLLTDSEKAIVLIFKRYYGYLCKIVYKIIPDNNLVEDLTQDVFYELWRKKEQLSVTASLKAYIRRAAVNKSLNYIRDQKIKFADSEQYPAVKSKAPSITQQLEADELQDKIDLAIDRLPHRCRIVFILSRFEDMTYNEIAEQLDISVKTVENQISKALKLLRESLSDFL